jgi:hypothetical protein
MFTNVHSSTNGSAALCWSLFSFGISFYTDGRPPWTRDQPVATHRTTQTQNKRIHTPNIHALSGIRIQGPSVQALDRAATVIGIYEF